MRAAKAGPYKYMYLEKQMLYLPQRKPTRLKRFDYSSVNYYFVTICTKDKKCFFGKIENGGMLQNKIGKLINQVWLDLPHIFSNMILDEFIVMPNHVHGIIIFNQPPIYKNAQKPATLSNIIGALKSKSNFLAHKQVLAHLQKLELWQKTFYDRIIRNEEDLLKTREYIKYNVAKWEKDEYFR